MDEYDKTPSGKKKLKAYEKEIELMEDDPNWESSKKAMQRFDKVENDYLYNQGRYVAKRMEQIYGKQNFADYYNNGSRQINGTDIYDSYGKLYVRTHSY